jgi:hypothetical protein
MRNMNKGQQNGVLHAVSRVFGVLCALLLIFGAGDVFGVSLAITGTAASQARVQDRDSSLRKPSVSDVITLLDTSDFPFTTLMQRIRKGSKPKQEIHKWGEVSTYPRTVTINGSTTAGSANANKTVTVDSVQMLKANDVLIGPDNTTDATLQYIVVSASGTSLVLRALPKDTSGSTPYTAANYGTVPAFADNEALYWVGNAKSQGDDASDARAILPATKFNYVQTEDLTIEMTDHMLRSENFGPKDWDRIRRDNLREFRKNWEYSAMFNEAPSITGDVGDSKLVWKMGGMKHFANSTLSLSSSAAYADIVDFLYAASSGNNGSRRRVLFGGSDLMEIIDKVNTGSNLNVVRGEKVLGIEITSLVGRKLRLDTIYHPGFDETGRSDEGLVADLNLLEWNDYQPVERRMQDFKKSTAGTDAEGEYYIQKSTLTCRNAGAHFWVAAS